MIRIHIHPSHTHTMLNIHAANLLIQQLGAVLLAATWPPQKPMDLTDHFRQEYQVLDDPAPLHRQVTPTLRFSYVSPHINGTSTWRNKNNNEQQQLLLADNDSSLLHPDPNKLIAIYLPGLDGYGISAHHFQFDDLAHAFQLWRLTIQGNDRSSLTQVVNATAQFITDIADSQKHKVILIGESCGGVIAAATALLLQDSKLIQGLVLVNPATSFEQTIWERVVPLVTTLQYWDTDQTRADGITPYSVLGSLLLAVVIPDNNQVQRIVKMITDLPDLHVPPTSLTDLQQVWEASLQAFRETELRLPPDLLEHRMTWLMSGANIVNQRLKQLQTPTLVVAGEDDRLLPSAKEARRLNATLPNSQVLLVRGRGHFVLDENVNLTEAILYSIILKHHHQHRKTFDPILDWSLPDAATITKSIDRTVQPARIAHSPVFFCTDKTGKRWKGLGKFVNKGTPIVVVGNHQFGALDLRLLVTELYEQRGIFLRGLAHPVTFTFSRGRPRELLGRTPGLLDTGSFNPLDGDYQLFGAVEVTPRNYYRLMSSGQNVLLFPGGAKEALSGRTDYPLFWPEKIDFIRTAARFNATIVPLSAIGMADGVNVLLEPRQLVNLPFVGEQVRVFNLNVSGARYDEKNETEVIGFPLALPKAPARNYFIFGKPIDLTDVDHNDKRACEKAYLQAKWEVRRGLDDLLRARDKDPFKDTRLRLAYESIFKRTAPTFPVDELNKQKTN